MYNSAYIEWCVTPSLGSPGALPSPSEGFSPVHTSWFRVFPFSLSIYITHYTYIRSLISVALHLLVIRVEVFFSASANPNPRVACATVPCVLQYHRAVLQSHHCYSVVVLQYPPPPCYSAAIATGHVLFTRPPPLLRSSCR
jgi:hypothetical protein